MHRRIYATANAVLLVAAIAALAGCAGWREAREPDEGAPAPLLAEAKVPHRIIGEALHAPGYVADELDSPASWIAPGGQRQVIVTAKATHQLLVFDGASGALLRRVGGQGSAPGRFDRPNGISVWADYALVVERDNRRVQVLSLRDWSPLATFGEAQLRSPYGLWLWQPAPGELEVWVTDSYMAGQDTVPPLAELNARIKRYRLVLDGNAVSAQFIDAIGDTTSAGALRVAESMMGDVANRRVLVAEEDRATGTGYRVYDLDGRYTGVEMGVVLMLAQAEGIALKACDDGSGYWIASDQFKDRTLFRLFERKTLQPIGAFAGKRTANTDGIWWSAGGDARFPAGVLYAIDGDAALSAFDWRNIAAALGLPERCTE